MAENKKKLPKSEWDFSGLDSKWIQHAFFYEYCRQSGKVSALVQLYRKVCKYYVRNPHSGKWIPAPDLTEEQNVDRVTIESRFKPSEYAYILVWLSECSRFPETPFLELSPSEYENAHDILLNWRGLMELGRCPMEHLNSESFDYVFEGLGKPVEDKGVFFTHLMLIDWKKTNGELQQEFSCWLKDARRQLRIRPIPEAKRGLFHRELKLPGECKKLITALTHLGKLRCLESSGSWEKYLAVYQEDKSDRRSLEKDVSAARKIIAWLEEKV